MGVLTKAWLVLACLLISMSGPVRAQTVTADDTARVLAGMAPSAGSPLAAVTEDPAWRRHAAFLDNAFNLLEQRQLSRIRSWADLNLAAPRPAMFYFFSGPDFLYADAFHSKATTYVMAALEPTGPVPDLTRLPPGSIGPALSYVERSLQSILSFSFFITKNMKSDLRDGEIEGTLPILYVFLARTGKTIRSASLIWLDESGGLHAGNEPATRNATRGARIKFAGADGVAISLVAGADELSYLRDIERLTKTTLPREDRRTPGHRDAAPAGQPQRPGGRPGMQNARANDGGNAAKGPRRRRRSNAKMPALPGNRQEPNRPSQGGGKSGSIQGVAFLHR
ncbi:MAG: hypothetical protein E6447_21250, partial [Bradyrhizobium sp.]|nr:hypothetical protein [Bradyrhizobium sp.]